MINKYGQHQLGGKWRERREAKGLTVAEVAQKVGVTHSVPSKWELGGLPAAHNLARYAQALGYASVGDLMADDPAKTAFTVAPAPKAPAPDPTPAPAPKAPKPPALRQPVSGHVELQMSAYSDAAGIWIYFDAGLPPVRLTKAAALELASRLQDAAAEWLL